MATKGAKERAIREGTEAERYCPICFAADHATREDHDAIQAKAGPPILTRTIRF